MLGMDPILWNKRGKETMRDLVSAVQTLWRSFMINELDISLFGSASPVLSLGTITKEDESFCKTMMAYWANFVRTGWVCIIQAVTINASYNLTTLFVLPAPL